MNEQLELFETGKNVWVRRIWTSIGMEARLEVIAVLAQMGKALLETEKAKKEKGRKEGRDES